MESKKIVNPGELSIDDFTYDLPEEKIARYPLEQRDASKLLVYRDGEIQESTYARLTDFVPENSLLIFNNTKVVEARLLFEKATGSTIEIFCLEPTDAYADITTAMSQKRRVLWKCLVGGAKKWKEGILQKKITTKDNIWTLSAKKVEKRSDYFIIEFSWEEDTLSFAEVLHLAGIIPLPPYLNREAEENDRNTYQTVYAQREGSVAAPTAGLHFTETLLQHLKDKNIEEAFVTLHVGAGTFKPVKSHTMKDHEMHAEFIDIKRDFIQKLILGRRSGKIVVVGTTSMRTVESLYWIGVKLLSGREQLELQQWEAYELPQDISAEAALTAVYQYMNAHKMDRLLTRTHLIITPGYRLRTAHGLITNFHQPHSTLLLLVAAVIGEDWHRVYEYALEHDFRFLSYGDGSLLWGK